VSSKIENLPVEPRLLNIKRAAQYLGTAVWTVRELVWSRQIPYLQLGRGYLFDIKDLDKFVESRKVL
jgi:excisionase family DNA binding protein